MDRFPGCAGYHVVALVGAPSLRSVGVATVYTPPGPRITEKIRNRGPEQPLGPVAPQIPKRATGQVMTAWRCWGLVCIRWGLVPDEATVQPHCLSEW